MEVDVYDTYATGSDGRTIHFDVLVPVDTTAETAFRYAREWLTGVGLQNADLKQSRCNYCHTEVATEKVVASIEKDRYHIIRMEGCPAN